MVIVVQGVKGGYIQDIMNLMKCYSPSRYDVFLYNIENASHAYMIEINTCNNGYKLVT